MTNHYPYLIPVLGISCTGKSTLMDLAKKEFKNVGTIEVGRELRKRYPPSFFKGLGAVKDLEEEVWEIVDSTIAAAEHSIYLIDGMPRSAEQLHKLIKRGVVIDVLLLHANKELLDKRKGARCKNTDEYALATKRHINDRVQLYDVLFEILQDRLIYIQAIDTSESEWFSHYVAPLIRARQAQYLTLP